MSKPIIDMHIHIAAKDEPKCRVSLKTLASPAFLFMLVGNAIDLDQAMKNFDETIRNMVIGALNGSKSVDKGVLLAMDGIYRDGAPQESDFVVSNDYVRKLARDNSKVLFGASVNPMRPDAREELEKCLTGDPPAALIKWIPNSQLINPRDSAHDWFYERLREENVPLLCHTGPEYAVPVPGEDDNQWRGNPQLLDRALEMEVTVIAAHCATRFFPWEECDYLDELAKMMKRADKNGKWKLYADVSAMCTFFRTGTVDKALKKIPPHRMVLGSDYPIPIDNMPPVLNRGLTFTEHFDLLRVTNPIEKNYRQLLAMGFPETIGTKAAELLNPGALMGLLYRSRRKNNVKSVAARPERRRT